LLGVGGGLLGFFLDLASWSRELRAEDIFLFSNELGISFQVTDGAESCSA
jgi:hypothetical protein